MLPIRGIWRVSNAPVAIMTSPSLLAKPVTFGGPVAQAPAPVPSSLTPSIKAGLPGRPVWADTKRKVEVALTAAAIAAIIVQASRDQYHAGGKAQRLS